MISFFGKKIDIHDRKVWKEALDYYFLMVVALICLATQIGLTTFYFNLPHEVFDVLYPVTCLAAVMKVILSFKETADRIGQNRSAVDYTQNTGNKEFTVAYIRELLISNKDMVLSLPAALVFYLAFPSEHYLYQRFLALLIIGCVGIGIKKFFIAAFIPSIMVIIVMMFASLDGAILSLAAVGRNIRSYWGHISPTDLGTAVLMSVCFLWILFKDLSEAVFLVPVVFSLFISFYVTRCNTSGYLTILLIGMFLCRSFGSVVVEKKGRLKWTQKLVDAGLLLAFPVLGLLVLAMVYAYYKQMSFAGSLDSIFHQRLSTASNMLAVHGVHPFGTYFEMFGNGGATIAKGNDYTFIDSSYPQILIRYGYVTYVMAAVLWVFATWRAIQSGNRRTAYVMALLAVDFVMEHHWFELSYNPFVLLPFADFAHGMEEKLPVIGGYIDGFKERWKNKKYAVTFTAVSLCMLAILFLLLPTAFSWLRTIFNGCGLYGGGWNGVVVFAVITLLLMTVLAGIWCMSGLAAAYAVDQKISRFYAVPLAAACVFCVILLLSGDILIRRITEGSKERIEEERGILELVVSEASGKVYADKLPEVYIRNIKGIHRGYFCGEDFARYDNATVITDAGWDSSCLIGRGFLYLPLSEEDAIYSNDDQLIGALQQAGCQLKGYNSHEYVVDLPALAGMNGLEVLEDGAIQLTGTERQIAQGPHLDLNYGAFTARFKMKLAETGQAQEDKICTVRIASYGGESVRAAAELYRRDFDEAGNLDYEVRFGGGGLNFEYLVAPEAGASLVIDSISYRRTPDNDTHNRIDSEGRVIRTEYYDLEGNPLEVSGGYYGCELAYDDNDNVIMRRYLGSDFQPVLISSGYAEIRLEYNNKKEVTKESYYGMEGEPIALPGGQHVVEKEYDFSKNLISERYYDLDGQPVLVNEAYFKYIRIFNEDHRWIRTEYYDTEDNLILQKGNYAITERDYDEAGNPIEDRYYGLQEEPVLYSDAYHKVKRVYNEKNQCVKEQYYGIGGESAVLGGNYAGYERELDDLGNVTKQTYLGTDGLPVTTDWGYATWHRAYSSKKQIVREEYYDVNGNRTLLSAGQSAVAYEYDETGNRTSDAYFGLNDENIRITSGFWKVVRTYNEKRQNIHEDYFDIDGKPAIISGKYAMVDFSYDENGKLIKKTFKDATGAVVEEQVIE